MLYIKSCVARMQIHLFGIHPHLLQGLADLP